MKRNILLLLALLALNFSIAQGMDIYVSPDGSDSQSGQVDQPLKSLAVAQQKARAFAGKESVTVYVADGVYYLPETLIFSPADSGTAKNPIVYRADNEGRAVLSGGSKLELIWNPFKNGIFKAQTPKGLKIDQLYINSKNQRMARYPNYDSGKKAEPYQGYAADAYSKERAAGWADPNGGYIHAMHRSQWGGYHYRIAGKKANGEVAYEGGWQNNRQMGMHKDFRMVENIFEELDAPGEWFHNAKTSTLYYMPEEGVDLNSAAVEVVRLRHLIEFQGSESAPVKHITFQGFVVRHAARTFMDTKEPMVRSDWTIYRGGSFLLSGTEDIRVLDCEFDQVGGNAIFVNNYNRRTLVKGCHIHDTGASGVCFIGDPNAVHDPLFEYRETNDLDKMDRTVGPKTDNYPSSGIVEDCLIHGIGRTERQTSGVTIDMAMKITVRDTSIYDCARSGINIGDGAWGGHLIERCDVFDTVLETHDHGSFNSWGRDRFWHNDRAESQRVIDKDPNLPFLDAMHTTTIRNSRWRCDHGWDIDLDDGSTNYEIYNNVMLAGGLKLREGFRRRAWNNIAVHGGLHPHVWFNQSGDEVYHNIFMNPHKPARMGRPFTDQVRVDENFFGAKKSSVMTISITLGWDEKSAFGDPMFVDPASGDFRVKAGSPALKMGFKNFPMDQFGVKKPSLRGIARTPDLSPPKKVKRTRKAAPPRITQWMGATLGDLTGAEFSAYGVSKQEGGIALKEVPKGSKAAEAGLQKGDLIQGLNGQSVSNSRQFSQTLRRLKSEELKLKVVRNQQVIELVLPLDKKLIIQTASPAGSKKQPAPATYKQPPGTKQKSKDNKPAGGVGAAIPNGGVKRPNIVFVMSDDQRWDTFGCYGRTDVLTPSIDKLAASGVTFDNAYYAVAICMPSRATMFTGRYFSDHQSGFTYPFNRRLPAEEFADSYPAQMRAAGYRTGFVGKFGTSLEDLPKTVAEHFDFYVGVSPTSKKGPIFPADATLKQICRKDRNPKERTLVKGDAMIHFLETQPKGKPFCLSVSFDAVKNDRDSDMYGPHEELFKDRQMWVPDNYVAGENEKLPQVLKDNARGVYLHRQRTSTPEEYQRRTRRFAVQGYTVDQQVKRLMDKLKEMGELENTVVIYTSDNGRFHGSQGLFDKCILYDEAMKQPLIVFDPRAPKSRRGTRVDAMVSSVDIAPTILSLAGLNPPTCMKGRDLGNLVTGTQDLSKWRDTVLMENFFIQEMFGRGRKKGVTLEELNEEVIANNRSYRTRGVRTKRYKYFIYYEHSPVIEELYDMKKDPHEQNNLVSSPEHSDLLEKLRAKTNELQAQATE